MSEILLPLFSSRIFMIAGLTFKSLIHFEFILVCGIRRWCSFIFLHVSVQFSQHHLLNKLSLTHCICLLLQNIVFIRTYAWMWLSKEEDRDKQEGAREIGPPWTASLHSLPPGSKGKALGDSRPTPWGQPGESESHWGKQHGNISNYKKWIFLLTQHSHFW